MRMLLLGCGGNAGINFVKSIKQGSKETFVYGLDTNKYNVYLSNCDVKEVKTFRNDEEKVAFILELVKKNNIQFIHAQPDPEVSFLIRNRDKFKKYVIEYSDGDSEICGNKQTFQQLVKNCLNLSYVSYGLVEALNNPRLFDELVGSGGKVWFRAISGAGSRAALPISSFEMMVEWSKYWKAKSGLKDEDFQICEMLPGREYAVQTFWINGELYQSQARERLVYFFGSLMPSGQSSTPAVARVIKDPEVYAMAHDVVRSVNSKPHGIYCVDMKTNANYQIIPTEINYGRLFTTSDFFSTVGVNTPYALADYHINNKLPEKKINSVDKDYYWIRGLDCLPVLVEGMNE